MKRAAAGGEEEGRLDSLLVVEMETGKTGAGFRPAGDSREDEGLAEHATGPSRCRRMMSLKRTGE